MIGYLNGEALRKDAPNDKLVNLSDPIILGDEKGMGRFFSGTMDEVAIFNRALSGDEVKQFMNSSIDKLLSVESKGKLVTTWAELKAE
jgi:hypothetical protein